MELAGSQPNEHRASLNAFLRLPGDGPKDL